ncbi:hypothetical protein BV20DRAFT_1050881 [Pilatotrama ljubarskyi]|nr:hypothetical protein BV20DRAFT_1050881 [Pilatotrama ljubarskyi]
MLALDTAQLRPFRTTHWQRGGRCTELPASARYAFVDVLPDTIIRRSRSYGALHYDHELENPAPPAGRRPEAQVSKLALFVYFVVRRNRPARAQARPAPYPTTVRPALSNTRRDKTAHARGAPNRFMQHSDVAVGELTYCGSQAGGQSIGLQGRVGVGSLVDSRPLSDSAAMLAYSHARRGTHKVGVCACHTRQPPRDEGAEDGAKRRWHFEMGFKRRGTCPSRRRTFTARTFPLAHRP